MQPESSVTASLTASSDQANFARRVRLSSSSRTSEILVGPCTRRGLRSSGMILLAASAATIAVRSTPDPVQGQALGERAQCRQTFATLGRARAVKGADRRTGDTIENAVAGRPQIPLTARPARQVAQNPLAFLPIGLALDSATDRVTVLAHRSNPPHERHSGHGPLPCPAWRRVSGCPARRSAHTVRSRWSSPALAFCTMPWK